MLDTSMDPPGSRRVIFCFPIPSWVYPWALLVLLSFMMENVSFVGHLAGIFCGYLYYRDIFGFLSLPLSWIEGIETSPRLSKLTSLSVYRSSPIEPLTPKLGIWGKIYIKLGNSLKKCKRNCCSCFSSLSSNVSVERERRNAQRNAYQPVIDNDIDIEMGGVGEREGEFDLGLDDSDLEDLVEEHEEMDKRERENKDVPITKQGTRNSRLLQ